MSDFSVWLYALDSQDVPGWVRENLDSAGIRFHAAECRDAGELLRLAIDYDVLWLFGGGDNYTLTGELLAQLPNCRAILRTGSGTDNVPVARATELGVLVVNTPDSVAEAVAEAVADHSVALLFSMIRQIPLQARLVREGIWDRARAWPNWHLKGQTVGLVGFGNISRIYVRRLRGYDVRFLVSDPGVSDEIMEQYGVQRASLHELAEQSDFVSVHCNLNPHTHHLIDASVFRRMKPTAFLVNVSRGPVVDEAALADALRKNLIAGAALDVLEQEPPAPDNPLLTMDNVVITPHVAAYTDEYLTRSWECSVDALRRLARGERPFSIVNPGALEVRDYFAETRDTLKLGTRD